MPRPVPEQTLDLGAPGSSSTTARPRPRWRSTCWMPPTTPTRRWPVRAGTVVDAEVRVTAEDGTPNCPPERSANCASALRSPCPAYHDAPELTAETWTGGWVRTRDLARFDDRGYLTLVDRTSDMIITGGYNVYPREVEASLTGAPRGSPGRRGRCTRPDVGGGGHRVRDAATGRGGHLRRTPRRRPHCPRGVQGAQDVHVVDSLPLSPVGKVLLRALREPLWSRGNPVMTGRHRGRDGPSPRYLAVAARRAQPVDGETAAALADAFRPRRRSRRGRRRPLHG
jgi:hypothetical protein